MSHKHTGDTEHKHRIETKIAWLIKDVDSASQVILGENLSEFGLYAGQPRLMHLIRMNPGSTQNQIAKRMRVSPSSLSMSIKRMEKQKLVERVTPDNDLRRNELHLTEAGEAVSLTCKTVIMDLHQQLLAGFSEEEKETLQAYLERMMENALVHPLYTRAPDEVKLHRPKQMKQEETAVETETTDD